MLWSSYFNPELSIQTVLSPCYGSGTILDDSNTNLKGSCSPILLLLALLALRAKALHLLDLGSGQMFS